jgi:hypothetical protein
MYGSGSGRPLEIAFWEFPVLVIFIAVVGLVHSRKKNQEIVKHPEYRYYLWGLYSKIMGGVAFALIYVYYYDNGDTISFFLSSVPLVELFLKDPGLYLQALFADNSMENRYRFFDGSTGYPLGYIYVDTRSYFLVRLISPLTALAFKSFLLTGALVSTLAYGGVWRLYRTLVHYYPLLQDKLAFAVLFMPSCLFWGSGIIKDTFTFASLCWFVHALDNIFFQKRNRTSSWLAVLLSSVIMIGMKPYIFMMIFPASLSWLLYHRVARIRNALVRVLVLPVAFVLFGTLTLMTLNALGDKLSKFSLDRVLETMVVSQADMKRGQQYGENYFDLGEIEPTWSSVFSKAPAATFAGLFMPSFFQVDNVVMLMAALENAWLLLFFVSILVQSRLLHFFALLRSNPLLQMFYVFAFAYAFMIGVTTPNYGALVRFKIPLIPLFVSGMYITAYILKERKAVIASGKRFDFKDYSDGDPKRLLAHATGPFKSRMRPRHVR